jgi:hypothetical protein
MMKENRCNSEVLIEKHWRGKVKRTVCELFWEEVNKAPSKSEVMTMTKYAAMDDQTYTY